MKRDLRPPRGLSEGNRLTVDWPYKTLGELSAAGYQFRNVSTCTGSLCKKQIIWYRTPAGKLMPIDSETLLPHWSVCPSRDEFKGGTNGKDSGSKKADRPTGRLRHTGAQGTLFGSGTE